MNKKINILICFAVLALAGNTFAAIVYNQWSGAAGTSDWNTAANWALGVPFADNGVDQQKAGAKSPTTWPVIESTTSPTPVAFQVTIGGSTGGKIVVNGGQFNVTQYITIAAAGTDVGTFEVNGGTITCGQGLYVGQKGTGVLTITNGAINLTGNLSIADNGTTANGTLHLDGGVITAALLRMKYSGSGTALLDVAGGTLILNGDQRAAITGFGSMIQAYGGLGTLNVTFDSGTNKTTITASLALPNATNPNPASGSSNVVLNPTLNWTAGTGATSHKIYFGTTNPPTLLTEQAQASFAPGVLSPSTTYFWQVDEVAGSVITTGSVWSFTTTSGLPGNPTPADGAGGIGTTASLSWTAGLGATSHNVYFGTTNPPALASSSQAGTTFTPPTMSPGVTYYWKVEEIGPGFTIAGPVWSFSVADTEAFNPAPADAATGTPIMPTLSWTAGAGAVSHDVYFGTTSPGSFIGNQAATTYSPGLLAQNTKYYWRIDERDAAGNVTTGVVWSFTTGTPPVVYPYLTWRSNPETSVTVNWYNPVSQGDTAVDYGTTSAYGQAVSNSTATSYHHVEITGLSPSTTYHYRVRSSDGTVGSDKTFTTADAVADANTFAFSFALYGDPRGTYPSNEPYYTRHQAMCDWIASQGYKFALQTGDIVWAGNSTVQEPLSAQNWYQDFFRLERNLAGSKVVMGAMGNHEVQVPVTGQTATFTYYYDLFKDAYPANGPAADGKGRVYSFNYGNAHFVSLSSYQVDPVTAQKNWLISDLTAARANPNIKWIFVFMHAPLYTTNGHKVAQSMIDAWTPVFESYGVDIVFGGHNHCYERSYPLRGSQVAEDGRAPIYVTNGMGGAEFNSTLPDPLFAAGYGSQMPGAGTVVTGITINGLHMTVTTVKNSTGEPVDTFELVKTPPPVAGDFNDDYQVDYKDLGIFGGTWLDSGIWP